MATPADLASTWSIEDVLVAHAALDYRHACEVAASRRRPGASSKS